MPALFAILPDKTLFYNPDETGKTLKEIRQYLQLSNQIKLQTLFGYILEATGLTAEYITAILQGNLDKPNVQTGLKEALQEAIKKGTVGDKIPGKLAESILKAAGVSSKNILAAIFDESTLKTLYIRLGCSPKYADFLKNKSPKFLNTDYDDLKTLFGLHGLRYTANNLLDSLYYENRKLLIDAVDETITTEQMPKLIKGLAQCESTQISGNLGLFFHKDQSGKNLLTPLAAILEHTEKQGKALDHLVTIAGGMAMTSHSRRSRLSKRLPTDFSNAEKEQAKDVLEKIKTQQEILEDPYFEDYLEDFANKRKNIKKFKQEDLEIFKEKKLSGITDSDFEKLSKIKKGVTDHNEVITDKDALLILKYPTLLIGDEDGVLTKKEKDEFKKKLQDIYDGIDIQEKPYLGYLLLDLPAGVITTTTASRTGIEEQTNFKKNAQILAWLEVARPKGMYFGYGFEFDVNDKKSNDNIKVENDKVYIKIQKKMPGSSDKFNKGDYVCIGDATDVAKLLSIENTPTNPLNANRITQEHLPQLSANIRCKGELTVHRFRDKNIDIQQVETLGEDDKKVFVQQKGMLLGKSKYKAATTLEETEFKKQFAKNNNKIKFPIYPVLVPGDGGGAAPVYYQIAMEKNGVKTTIFYADQNLQDLTELADQNLLDLTKLPKLLEKIRKKEVIIYDKDKLSVSLQEQQITSLLENAFSNPSTSLQPTRCLPCIRNCGRRPTP